MLRHVAHTKAKGLIPALAKFIEAVRHSNDKRSAIDHNSMNAVFGYLTGRGDAAEAPDLIRLRGNIKLLAVLLYALSLYELLSRETEFRTSGCADFRIPSSSLV